MGMNHMGMRMARRFAGAFAAATMGLSMFIAAPANAADNNAAADQYPDVMLAAFTNSALDSTDSIYMSMNGVDFQKIAEPFTDATPHDGDTKATASQQDGRTWDVYTMSCPSIIYKDGYFWMLANEGTSKGNKQLGLIISYSKDLVHWSDPLRLGDRDEANGHKYIDVENAPDNGTGSNQFDAVAADWAVAPNGDVYVVVSLGRYGAWHGEAEKDTMAPYLVKLSGLSTTNDPSVDPKQNGYSVTASTAKRINLPLADNNRIDGSLYFEGGSAYLSIKRNGVTNEIWKTSDNLSDVGNAGSWASVNGNVVTGYEAPSLTKLGDRYYYYTDELASWTPGGRGAYWRTGTNAQSSASLNSGWTGTTQIQATGADGRNYTVNRNNDQDNDGPRHGTVITVTDPAAKAAVFAARQNAGWGKWTGFWDVIAGKTSHDQDILWLADQGISTGYSDHSFGGMRTVVRQDMAAFLYRMAGSPEFDADAALAKKPFTDVDKNTSHYKEILWLASTGITQGYKNPDGKTYSFGGMRTVVRQDMAAFLHRYAQSKDAAEPSGQGLAFTDVNDQTSHAEDIVWLSKTGVTTGYDNGNGTVSFGGMRDVVRQDMAAFLHRMNTNVLTPKQ